VPRENVVERRQGWKKSRTNLQGWPRWRTVSVFWSQTDLGSNSGFGHLTYSPSLNFLICKIGILSTSHFA